MDAEAWHLELILSLQKPQDVSIPIIIDPVELQNIVAFMVQESFMRSYDFVIYPPQPAEVSHQIPAVKLVNRTPVPLMTEGENAKPIFVKYLDEPKAFEFSLGPGEALPYGLGQGALTPLQLNLRDLVRMKRVLAFIRETEHDCLDYPQSSRTASGLCYKTKTEKYHEAFHGRSNVVLELRKDVSLAYRGSAEFVDLVVFLLGLFRGESWKTMALRGMLPILYAGIHLTAWSYQFPTSLERTLWMASCFTICGGTFALLLSVNTARRLPVSLLEWAMGFLLLLSIFIIPLYAAARAFLIVEAFLSLRSLPIGVFWLPSWLQMIPHI